MSVCGSLDFMESFEKESEQLSWLVEEISVLYEENSSIVQKIMKLNVDLENFEEFYEETMEDDDDAYVIDNDIYEAALVFKIKEGGKRG